MRQLISDLRYVHAAFNLVMLLLVFYHGRVGLKIRRARISGAPADFVLIKRHRRFGPIIAPLGIMGFLAGVGVILMDKGRVAVYPIHFMVGASIASALVISWLLSRMIRGAAPQARKRHYMVGMTILCLYVIQLLLGLGMLL